MTDTSIHGLGAAVSQPPAAAALGSSPAAEGRFGEVMRKVQPPAATEVRQGDTLIGIVKRHMNAVGRPVDDAQALRMAHQLAREHRIANPDLILPGQQLSLQRLVAPTVSAAQWARSQAQPAATVVTTSPPNGAGVEKGAMAEAAPRPVARGYQTDQTHPVLERTLQRAVQRGFVPPHEVQAVHRRILDMADKYGFSPDDFAKVSLMESDGMNPRATNGSCHGIIQFCGGPGRGADSVGFGRNARDILGLSVVQQLDLVDRYLADVGLRPQAGGLKLDDLYLSVLMPSARRESRPHVPLQIAGQQAARLHEGGNRAAPITRQSIVQGLVQHAMARLGVDGQTPGRVASASEGPASAP